ncbi:EF-hand calcium-binding domain-containing protein 12 [Apus apus]|uniref:EF-hand calcium-binding domain-containing protein 12 n=1 Tax=Apus apus TaxID=8895 RepID=UPI0021F846B6|nr:EF-hand calcium-binding domain-containing protein 12 [Apus apus]
MTDLQALITNIELCSRADGVSTITFPTLKKLSVSDVITIWSSVSKRVQRQLLKAKTRAVKVTGLGTFRVKKWLSFENGEVHTFQKPEFSVSVDVAQIRGLQHASVPVPEEIKTVSVSYKMVQSDLPYSEEVVQNCMQETLGFIYFILRNREDVDLILKDLGTLAIRGTEVTMAFCKDFLLSLNKSTYVVEKMLTRRWVILDKEVLLSPSHFGRVHQFPQFEIRPVPRRVYVTDKETVAEFESALSSMGGRGKKRQSVLELYRQRKLEASMAKSKEKEKRTAGGVILPELPQEQAESESNKMKRAQQPQKKEDGPSSPETTFDTEEQLKEAEAWIRARRQFRTELESLGDMEKWLINKPSLSQLENRCLQRIQAHEADSRAAGTSDQLDSLDSKDSPAGWKEKSRMGRSGTGPVGEHCWASAGEATLGELVSRTRKNAVTCYLKCSKLCKELHVPIADPKLERGEAKTKGLLFKIPFPSSTLFFHRHLQRTEKQKSSNNKFWPGHLLDKLCLYFPDKQHDRAHALFSYVPPARPTYRGI